MDSNGRIIFMVFHRNAGLSSLSLRDDKNPLSQAHHGVKSSYNWKVVSTFHLDIISIKLFGSCVLTNYGDGSSMKTCHVCISRFFRLGNIHRPDTVSSWESQCGLAHHCMKL